MRYLKEWPRLLLTLPNEIRLSLLTLCIILCLGIYILTFPVSYTGYLLVIPVGLATWIFQKRGLVICLAVGLAVLLVYHSIRLRSIWWPFSFALFFWGGFFILLLVGYIMVIVRTLVDSGNVAQLKVEHARQQAAIAYDQQLQLNQLKDHFVTSVNHELHIPLTVLGRYLELLKAQHEHPNPIRQSHLLSEALESYGELVRLVDWVLDATISEELPLVHCEVVSVCRGMQEVPVLLNSVDVQASTIRLEIAKQVVV